MHPIICKLGPVTIYSYGLAMFVATVVSLNFLLKEAGRQGFDKNKIFDLFIIILFSGIIGARLLYILLNIGFYIENPVEIIMLQHGGLAILGGMLFAPVCGLIYAKFNKLSFLKVADLFVPFVALGHSIGRIGCFFNGCCYGIESAKFGFYFPVHQAYLIPAQLIDSVVLLILFVILRIKQLRPHYKGEIFINYIWFYSISRFFMEFIRADSDKLSLGLTLFQYICIIIFVIGSIIFVTIKTKWNQRPSK